MGYSQKHHLSLEEFISNHEQDDGFDYKQIKFITNRLNNRSSKILVYFFDRIMATQEDFDTVSDFIVENKTSNALLVYPEDMDPNSIIRINFFSNRRIECISDRSLLECVSDGNESDIRSYQTPTILDTESEDDVGSFHDALQEVVYPIDPPTESPPLLEISTALDTRFLTIILCADAFTRQIKKMLTQSSSGLKRKKVATPRKPPFKKDPSAPSRPITTFFMFQRNNKERIIDQVGSGKVWQTVLKQEWDALSSEEKKVYQDQYKDDLEQYRIKKKHWNESKAVNAKVVTFKIEEEVIPIK